MHVVVQTPWPQILLKSRLCSAVSIYQWERGFQERSLSVRLILVVAAKAMNCRPGIEADPNK